MTPQRPSLPTDPTDSSDSDGDIDLFELISFLIDHWMSLLGSAVAAGLVGLSLVFVIPSKFELVMPIQISEVGGMGPVESPAVVIERIKSDGFKSRLAKDLGEVSLKASIKVDPIKGTELVLLKIRASSPESAQTFAQSVLQALALEHSQKAQPYRQRMKLYLEDLVAEHTRARKTRDELLSSIAKSNSASDTSDGAMLLKTNLLTLQDNYLQSLSQRVLMQQSAMDPAKDFDTRAFVEGVLDEDMRPVFPRAEVFVPIGAIVGGFVMLVWLLIRRSWAQRVGSARPAA
jgi:hypothetical protein